MSIVEFLRARLDEDERRARDGYYSDTHWQMWTAGAHLAAWHEWRIRFPREWWDAATNDAIADATRDALRERITAHEEDRSARALAEIEAKRFLLAGCESALSAIDANPTTPAAVGAAGPVDHLLRYFAAPYAAHPDYDERWRP